MCTSGDPAAGGRLPSKVAPTSSERRAAPARPRPAQARVNVKTYSPTVRPASKIVQNTKEASPNLQAGTDRGAKSQYMADVMAYGKDGAAAREHSRRWRQRSRRRRREDECDDAQGHGCSDDSADNSGKAVEAAHSALCVGRLAPRAASQDGSLLLFLSYREATNAVDAV